MYSLNPCYFVLTSLSWFCKILTLGEARWSIYRNSVYCLCNFFANKSRCIPKWKVEMGILDLKTTIPEMKNSPEGLSSSFGMLVKRVNESEDRPTDRIQSEKEKNVQSLRLKHKTLGVSEGERKVQKTAFWETSQIWWRALHIQLSESWWINTERPVPWCSVDDLLEDYKETVRVAR